MSREEDGWRRVGGGGGSRKKRKTGGTQMGSKLLGRKRPFPAWVVRRRLDKKIIYLRPRLEIWILGFWDFPAVLHETRVVVFGLICRATAPSRWLHPPSINEAMTICHFAPHYVQHAARLSNTSELLA